MLKGILFFSLFMSLNVKALVPLEGLIYGDVKNIQQFDPLSGVFTDTVVIEPELLNKQQRKKIEVYRGMYQQGANLMLRCEQESKIRYINSWKESVAKRSVISTLQYIGIDLSIRAIIAYMKKLEFTKSDFDNLVQNLVTNTCSQNQSIYSLKLIKNNFYKLYDSDINYKIPSIENSPYFTESIRKKTNSRKAKMNELNLAIRNFRAFCSWGGDTDNYRMLVPYLKNPFVMSYIFNHLEGKKVSWDSDMKRLSLQKNDKAIKVVCEDLICRKTNDVLFSQKFPKMIGSTELRLDLENLYCGHFKNVDYTYKDQVPQVKNWLKDQTLEEPILEGMNFISMISGVPDLVVASDNYKDLLSSLKENIDSRWLRWAKEKNEQFVIDLLYEESLNIDLVPMAKSKEVIKGEFQFKFDFTLGELDRVLKDVDKISAKFHLEFPKSYLRWVRSDYIKKNNKSDYEGIEYIEKRLQEYINIQLATKSSLFLIPLWNDKMGKIMTKELLDQLTSYRGSYFKDFSHKKIKVPVKMHFGLFALKYLNKKFEAKYRSKTLTLSK